MVQMSVPSNGSSASAPTTQLSDISRLSAITSEIVAIRQHRGVGDEAGEGLDEVVAALDATITVLLHAAPVSVGVFSSDVGYRAHTPARATASVTSRPRTSGRWA